MPVIRSQLKADSEAFKRNAEVMRKNIEQFRQLEQAIIAGAEKKQDRYKKRGLLLPHERLTHLLDPDTPFIALSSLAGYKMYDDTDGTGAGGGCIAGIGYVSGTRCLIRVDNYAVKGGTISPAGMEKALRMQQIALENKLPFITLAQSGGANLQFATETFAPGGKSFANQARMSAAGIPQITVVHGSATAGGAYQPGLSDYVVMVRDQATMYLAGPPLLRAATGEIATDEELGGSVMHTGTAGTADYLAENDADGIRIARDIMAMIARNRIPQYASDFVGTSAAEIAGNESIIGQAPQYCSEELLGIVPAEAKQPYDVHEIIARLTDGSHFLDFKPAFDTQTVCGHATIAGFGCGIIGNNGPITAQGAVKAAQFIQLCEQSATALIFLHNTTGFMVGTAAEQQGIIKHGSKMIQAVANASVPKISIVVGGSYGAGNYAMCGRGFDPRFIFAWPNSRTSVMGGAQAGKVLRIVTEAKMQKHGQVDETVLNNLEQQTAAMIDEGASAIACSARLWDDGLIDPRDTRDLLIELLQICYSADHQKPRTNTFGVARM